MRRVLWKTSMAPARLGLRGSRVVLALGCSGSQMLETKESSNVVSRALVSSLGRTRSSAGRTAAAEGDLGGSVSTRSIRGLQAARQVRGDSTERGKGVLTCWFAGSMTEATRQ